MSKKIIFSSRDPVYAESFRKPQPAHKDLPKWFKEQERYIGNKKEWAGKSGRFNHTVKACPAVFDAVAAGYLFYLDCDIYIERNENGDLGVVQAIDGRYQIVAFHDIQQVSQYSFDREYYDDSSVLKFQTGWAAETPKGYSCMYMHPMWRDDLPFRVLPGIVDQDNYKFAINFFFLIRKGFQGLIPEGTPIGQIIPFKRDKWRHETRAGTQDEWNILYMRNSRHIENGHKKTNLVKKMWN